MKISDLKGVFKKSEATIELIENPFEDYYIIKLKTALGATWKPGEHGIYRLPEKKIFLLSNLSISAKRLKRKGYDL